MSAPQSAGFRHPIGPADAGFGSLAYPAEVLGSKWTILILAKLLQGSQRFSTLQSALPRMSPRTLSDRLRWLESEGLVNRKAYPQAPPRVDYTLTPKGRACEPVLRAIRVLGAQWEE